jgi:hypothetical protein
MEGRLMARSEEVRARISRGLKYHHEARRKQVTVLPAAVRDLVLAHRVHRSVKPFLESALQRAVELETELGGSLSPSQRELLTSWVRRTAVTDAVWCEFLRTGSATAFDRASAHASAAERLLAQLGLVGEADDASDRARQSYREFIRGGQTTAKPRGNA